MSNVIKKSETIANLLKNFSNKDKLAILCYLWKDKKNVSELLKCCWISQSQMSQFLNKMKLEWILESEKIGKEVYYRIIDKKVLEIISSLKNIFN